MAPWELTSQIITIGLAAAGWGNYIIVRRRWQHDRLEHSRQEERWRRSPAELIWVAVEERDWPRADEGTYRARVATVRNDSAGPARDLDLWWFLDGKALPVVESCRRSALGPGEVWAVPEPTWLTHMGTGHTVTARLWFGDFRDQHWETSHRGQVRLLSEAVTEGYDMID